MTSPVLVSIDGLVKTYRGGRGRALDRVTLSVPRGSFFGLLGPNGAGKTSLISILCGVLAADAGSVRLHGDAGAMLSPRDARGWIGLVPQELAFYPSLGVRENLEFFAAMQGMSGARMRAAVTSALRIGSLEAVARQRAASLSGGLQRRLNLAIGVLHEPRLLVLDEPTVGVDAQSRQFLLNELKQLNARGTTIVFSSHYLEEVQQLCDSLAVIDHGRVVAQGTVADLLREDSVTLILQQAPTAAFLAALRALPSVTGIRHDGAEACRLALLTDTPQGALTDALRIAQTQRVAIARAGMGTRDLQSLFFQLTGSRMRDDAGGASATPLTAAAAERIE